MINCFGTRFQRYNIRKTRSLFKCLTLPVSRVRLSLIGPICWMCFVASCCIRENLSGSSEMSPIGFANEGSVGDGLTSPGQGKSFIVSTCFNISPDTLVGILTLKFIALQNYAIVCMAAGQSFVYSLHKMKIPMSIFPSYSLLKWKWCHI